jgi:hypothetical protein
MRRQIRDDLGSEKKFKECYVIYIKLFRIREEF